MNDRVAPTASSDTRLEAGAAATVLLEEAALARGLTTTRLRPLTFLAEGPCGGTIAFQGARSIASTHAGIHFCDARIHRIDRLLAAGVRVPRMLIVDADGQAAADAFAEGCPSGVILKPAQRSRSSASPRTASSIRPLAAQWDRVAGRLAPGARMVVEEFIAGEEYGFDVVAGRIVTARRLSTGEGTAEDGEVAVLGADEVESRFPSEALQQVRAAAKTVPPLASLSVRLVRDRKQAPGEQWTVVSLVPESDLAPEGLSPDWGVFLAGEILEAESDGLTAASAEPSGDPQKFDVRIVEVGGHEEFGAAVGAALTEFDLDGHLSRTDFRAVGGTLAGRPGDIARLNARIIRGGFAGETPEMVILTPIT